MTAKRLFFIFASFITVFIFSGGTATIVLAGGSVDNCSTNPSNPIINCGFETGDFSGWAIQDMPPPTPLLTVRTSGTALGFFTVSPTEGSFAATNSFDGAGPGTMKVGQDVTLPSSSQNISQVLTFDYRAAWDVFPIATQDRTFTVTVEPAGGGTPLQSTTILIAPVGTQNLDTGHLTGIVELDAFAGQTVRINFNWYIPESFTGPGSFQLDNISVVTYQVATVKCDEDPNNPFNNCGFETGDFTGWTTQDLAPPYYPLSVTGRGTKLPMFSMFPTERNFAAVNGFDGAGPGTIQLGQDVSLPGASRELTFDYRAVWDLFPGNQSRIFTVTIEPAGGGAPLETTTILTAPVGQSDTGILTGNVNLRPFAGQTVRINFNWYIPQAFTGPGSFQLDNVNVTFFSWPMFLPAIINTAQP